MDLPAHLPKNLKSEQVDALFASFQGEQTHSLVLNQAKMGDEEFRARFPLIEPHPFLKHVYSYKKEDYEFGKMALYDLGCYSIQDSAAMIPPYVLNPRKGERVLDLCAAPGGKSIFLSLLCQQEAIVLANDISLSRAKELSSNVERMGLGNVVVANDDFSKKCASYAEFFDAIMLDVPCSGTAMMRKNAQARQEWSPSKMERCVEMQLSLLEQAYAMLIPGGRMVYSTCSFCYEEDEGAILSFLSRHLDMHPQAFEDRPCYFHGEKVPESVYLFPFLYPGEGQFLCLLEKEGESKPREREGKKATQYADYFSFYGLEDRANYQREDALWSLPFAFPFERVNLLRAGLKVSSFPFEEPDNALAHYLGKEHQVELSQSEALRFLKGETLPMSLGDGYYLASYEGKGLGFFKMAKGQMKNRYPKGLRRSHKLI